MLDRQMIETAVKRAVGARDHFRANEALARLTA